MRRVRIWCTIIIDILSRTGILPDVGCPRHCPRKSSYRRQGTGRRGTHKLPLTHMRNIHAVAPLHGRCPLPPARGPEGLALIRSRTERRQLPWTLLDRLGVPGPVSGRRRAPRVSEAPSRLNVRLSRSRPRNSKWRLHASNNKTFGQTRAQPVPQRSRYRYPEGTPAPILFLLYKVVPPFHAL